jgi:hypothetical protein
MWRNKGKSVLARGRGRPLKTLILLIAIESFILLSLLGIFLWLVLTK